MNNDEIIITVFENLRNYMLLGENNNNKLAEIIAEYIVG